MAQINHPAPIGPYLSGFGGKIHLSVMYAATIGLAVVLLLALTVAFLAQRAQPSPAAAQGNAAVVDGWMSGVTAASQARAAAHAARADATRDGWSSYLLVREQPVVDGWSSYLLVREQPVVDGWAARYLVNEDE